MPGPRLFDDVSSFHGAILVPAGARPGRSCAPARGSLAPGGSSAAGLAADSAAATSAPRATLTLSQAEENALRNQPSLRQAHAQTDAAAGARRAGARGLPAAGHGHRDLPAHHRATSSPRPGAIPSTRGIDGDASTTERLAGETYNYFNFGVTASQLIYDFGQTSERWRSAGASRDAAQMSELTTEQQALLTVRSAYFLARADEDLITVARETLANQEKHFDQIQAFVGAGIRPEIDLAQARTAVANARVQLVTANNNHAVALAPAGAGDGAARARRLRSGRQRAGAGRGRGRRARGAGRQRAGACAPSWRRSSASGARRS